MKSQQNESPEPPDGGWGYVCIAAAFLLQYLFGLVVRSFGITYLLLLDRYDTTATLASWVGATNLLLYGLGGPLSSMLCKWFSHRSVSIAGCLFQAIGFIITGYSPNIATVYLGFGLFVGLGVALSTVSSFLILDKYFKKKKSMATCIAASGVGVSMFVLPPLMSYFDQEYGFQGTMLLLAGFCLNGIVCATFFRPVEWPKRKKESTTNFQKQSDRLFGHEKLKNSIIKSSENIVLTSVKHISSDKTVKSEVNQPNSEDKDLIKGENSTGTFKNIETDKWNDNSAEDIDVTKDSNSSQQNNGKTVGKSGNKETENAAVDDSLECEIQLSANISTEVETKENNSLHATPSKFRSCLSLIHDVPAVVGLMMLSLFFTICDSCVYAFLPALAIDQGIAKGSAKMLIAWGGISDMVHRIAYGFIMDISKIKPYRVQLYCVFALISSAITFTFPLYDKHFAYIIAVVLFGGFTGVVFAQRVTITSDLTGPERTPLAFGFVIGLNACGHVAGRMIGGVIKDHTGNYDLTFFISGSLPAVAAITFLILTMCCGKNAESQ